MKRYLCIITIFILIIDGVFCDDGYKYIGRYDDKKFYIFSKQKLNIGDLIKSNFEVKIPSGKRNYGGFDYAFNLKTKGIDGNIKINKVLKLSILKVFITLIVIKLWI